ncbi:MAG: amidohydrolase family protein, partial [Omnitrophica WOR_2 bacterium]
MELSKYRPHSKLVTKTTLVDEPRFPVIDAHNHLGEDFGGGWINRPLQELLDRLDQVHIIHLVDLDGGWGEDILYTHLEHLSPASERFSVFGGVNWSAWPERGDRFGEWAATRLREQVARGARGLKIWKPFGLRVKDQNGQLVSVDDIRLDPLWSTAGELNLPVMIHVADPVAFFDPLDEHNERWEELSANPDWQFTSPPYPPFITILEAFKNMVTRHPETTFIGAHVGCYAENLTWV